MTKQHKTDKHKCPFCGQFMAPLEEHYHRAKDGFVYRHGFKL